jgi:hypothetical protein
MSNTVLTFTIHLYTASSQVESLDFLISSLSTQTNLLVYVTPDFQKHGWDFQNV